MSGKIAGPRRKARIAALQALYEIDSSSHRPEEVVARLVQEKGLRSEAADFCQRLVMGVLEKKQDIDDLIRRFAPAFPVRQLAVIDRTVLHVAVFELVFDSGVPVKAAINEAVELAKSFGSDGSPKFVNGVLGSLVADLVEQRNEQELAEKPIRPEA